jgi:serine/threonine-protein kinase
VRSDGTVKVLDFGLAKLMERGPAAPSMVNDPSLSPTVTSPAFLHQGLVGAGTEVGVILGTAAYMSPEQARGKAVDKRSDVWAFGCVLYEMLTGRRAFEGEDVTETIAAVVRGTPEWNALPPDTPTAVRALLQGCLEKDRRQRIGDISTALFVLRQAANLDISSSATPVHAAVARPRLLRGIGYGAAALALVLVAIFVTWSLQPETVRPLRYLETTLPPLAGPLKALAITRDASAVLFTTPSSADQSSLFVRRLDRPEAPVELAERASQPFVDPTGRWAGFFNAQQLMKVPIEGGAPQEIARIEGGPAGAAWGDDDSIVFGIRATGVNSGGLRRVPSAGGTPAVLTTVDPKAGEVGHGFPHFLPDSRGVLFAITAGSSTGSRIALLDLRTPNAKPRSLIEGGSDPRYVASGHIVYLAGDTLRAIAFDLDRLETMGTSREVLPLVGTRSPLTADFDIASDGTLVFDTAGSATDRARTMAWVDRRTGAEQEIPAPPRAYLYPRLSVDRSRVALDIRDEQNDIWVWNLLRGGPLVNVTKHSADDRVVAWGPGDRYLLFGSTRAATPPGLYRQSSDGTGAAELLAFGGANIFPLSVHGSTALVHVGGGIATADIARLELPDTASVDHEPPVTAGTISGRASPGTPAVIPTTPLVATASGESNADVSPDGRWLVYESNDSGGWQIYVSPYPSGQPREPVAAGRTPLFSGRGDELFYVTATGTMMAVPLRPGKTWSEIAGTPIKIFDASKYFLGSITLQGAQRPFRMYDYDDRRRTFLMLKPEKDAPVIVRDSRLRVVANWLEELKRLVPRDR